MNPRAILKNVSIKNAEGKVITLKEYIKGITADEMKSDLKLMLDTIKTRIESTNDKKVLMNLYAILLSLSMGGEKKVTITGDAEDENRE